MKTFNKESGRRWLEDRPDFITKSILRNRKSTKVNKSSLVSVDEAQDEVLRLHKELEISQSVEIMRASNNDKNTNENEEFLIYASGQFKDGEYGSNPNLWEVELDNNATCLLKDLRGCSICVGGGFPLANIDDQLANRAPFEVVIEFHNADDDNSIPTSFCFCPNSLWLCTFVHGWPRKDWEAAIEAGELTDDFGEDSFRYLVEIVASKYPEATIEFKCVAFVARHVKGALKRLLPLKIQE